MQSQSLLSDMWWRVKLWSLTIPLGSRLTEAGASMAGLRRELSVIAVGRGRLCL